MLNQSVKAQTVDDVTRMIFHSREFHQSVLAILCVEMEGEPHKDGGAASAEADAEPLRHATHIHDDEHNEIHNQATGEDEEILRLQTLVFYCSPNPFVD